MQTQKGEVLERTKGTPQGGVISPLLGNLFLHYTLDVWLGKVDSTIEFVRYADDIIIHCPTQSQAAHILQEIKARVEDCGLTLHPEKTKILYCKDYRRQGRHKEVKFDFLGYSFQPRTTKSKKTGKLFLGFDCAISIQSRSRIFAQIRKMKIDNYNFKPNDL